MKYEIQSVKLLINQIVVPSDVRRRVSRKNAQFVTAFRYFSVLISYANVFI